jgi:hypothetical protein
MVQVSVSTIIGDVVRDEFLLNRALPRTLIGLLLRPGFLTSEYISGRVVRYIPPLRLYLVSSILFFLVVSFLGLRALEHLTVGSEAALPADPDSARAELLQRRAALHDIDTAGLPAAARPPVRRAMARTDSALAALSDTAVPRAAAEALLREAVAGETVLPPGSLQPWAQGLSVSSPSPVLQRAMERKLAELGHLPWRQALQQAASDLLDYAPHMVFLLLPAFALLLKLLYVRRGRYYAEHFVFALHVHAFFFLMFFIMLVLPWGRADGVLLFWMVAYVWLAMKRVYRQDWLRTTAKWWLLGVTYVLVLAVGLIGLMVATLLL